MGLPAGVVILGMAAAAYAVYTGLQLEDEINADYEPYVTDDDEEEEEIDDLIVQQQQQQQPVLQRRQSGHRFCTHPPVTRCESPPRLVRAPPRRRRRDAMREVLVSADGRLRRGMHKVKRRLKAVNKRRDSGRDIVKAPDEEEADDERGAVCVVDLEPIRVGERAVRLPCLHKFHADCILPYLESMDEPCCPIDRCPIPRDDVPLLPVWTVTM